MQKYRQWKKHIGIGPKNLIDRSSSRFNVLI